MHSASLRILRYIRLTIIICIRCACFIDNCCLLSYCVVRAAALLLLLTLLRLLLPCTGPLGLLGLLFNHCCLLLLRAAAPTVAALTSIGTSAAIQRYCCWRRRRRRRRQDGCWLMAGWGGYLPAPIRIGSTLLASGGGGA